MQQQERSLQLEAETAKQTVETILSSIRDGFVTFDRAWRYTYVNDRQLEILNLSREAVMGQNVWDVFPDVVGTEAYHQLHRAMNERLDVQFEFYYPMLNCWVEHRVYPTADGIAILVADISDRKRSEEKLRESEQRYRTLFETVDEGFCVCEMLLDENNEPTDYRFLEVNPLFEMMTGLEQAQGKTARELVPNLEAHWFEIYGRVALTGEPVRFENYSEAMNRWFEVSAFRIGEPQSYKFAILFKNITDRKQAELALRESEKRFRSMADNAPFMVWVTDPTGYCTYLSQSWYDFTDQTEESGLGLGWLNATHPNDRQYAERTFLDANERKAGFRLEYRLRRKDGEYIWMIDAANPWFGLDGVFKGYIGSVIDISDRKQVEAEREQLLAREQAAREQAETANRIKDEFLAVLSHELRSPLNPILGWSKLLQHKKLDAAKTTAALATIERNAQLQVQLIDDLLDISRILRGKMNLMMMPVDLGIVIAAALETVRLAAEAKSLQIQPTISPAVGMVNGDATRLQQVVWNLLANAVKFTPNGGQISVDLAPVGTQAQIQVKDTGKGISPDFLPYVFEHFRQEDGATTRKFGGLGLGLAIARQIVEIHGGTVRADSLGEGQGATFTIQIPLTCQSVEMSSLEQAAKSAVDISGIRVLVVEDDADSREFIAFALEQENAIVTVVASGVDALQAIACSPPDIVVSDIGMPNIDGYMLIQQIRRLMAVKGESVPALSKEACYLPAIALTAYAGELDQKQALAAGFERHLAKPLEIDELIKAIAALVRRSSPD